MKVNIVGILALFVVVSLSVGPVSATIWNVDPTDDIQDIIDNSAVNGDTINFLPGLGDYLDISLVIDKTLNLVGME